MMRVIETTTTTTKTKTTTITDCSIEEEGVGEGVRLQFYGFFPTAIAVYIV